MAIKTQQAKLRQILQRLLAAIAITLPAPLLAQPPQTPSIPSIDPLTTTRPQIPPPVQYQTRLAEPSAPATTNAPAPVPPDIPLLSGQTLQPIDFASVLKLAGIRNLDIAFARERVLQAVADLERARALWLPSLFIGPTYYRADGQIQTITGQVETIDRSSLFVGSTAALANGFPAASPGTGFPGLNGMSTILQISDAIYEPMAARRILAARKAGQAVVNNDTFLTAAESFFDLQFASGELAIAREAAQNAGSLSELTASYARSGAGLEADHRRALTELTRRRKQVRTTIGQLKVQSARLVGSLVLDPHVVVAPVEPAETVIHFIADDTPIEVLLPLGLRNRPELAQAKEQVEATILRLKQARLRPFVPALAVTYAGGGFGGGPGSFFGNFGTRGDAAVSLYWDLRNLGFTDLAIMHRRDSEKRAAQIDFTRAQAAVAADVIAAMENQAATAAEMIEARQSVTEAVDSLKLNFSNILRGGSLPGATRPIEVLQPIQALAQARSDYLSAVIAYNRSQCRLYRAIGCPPLAENPAETPEPTR